MTRIHVHTFVSQNSIPYAEYLQTNYNKLATNPNLLDFTAHYLDEFSKCTTSQVQQLQNFEVVQSIQGSGSIGHALGIISALHHRKDLGIHIWADADTVMLRAGWDVDLCQTLQTAHGGEYDIIGATYEKLGGISSGGTTRQTYKGRPNLTWLAFNAENANMKNFDPLPCKEKFLHIITPELSARYNLPCGYELLCDVGWKLPEFMDNSGLRDLGLKHLVPTVDPTLVFKSHHYHEEFHDLHGPLVGHQRGSMKHRFRIDPLSKQFYNELEEYLK